MQTLSLETKQHHLQSHAYNTVERHDLRISNVLLQGPYGLSVVPLLTENLCQFECNPLGTKCSASFCRLQTLCRLYIPTLVGEGLDRSQKLLSLLCVLHVSFFKTIE